MKFKVDDQVIHYRDGLCTIFSSTKIDNQEYFLLKTLDEDSTTIYVASNKADEILRDIMSKKQADELLKKSKKIKFEFNPNTKQRRDYFKKLLSTGDVDNILYLFTQANHYQRHSKDVKLGSSDNEILKYASNMLLSELAITYNKPKDKIRDFVLERIKKL